MSMLPEITGSSDKNQQARWTSCLLVLAVLVSCVSVVACMRRPTASETHSWAVHEVVSPRRTEHHVEHALERTDESPSQRLTVRSWPSDTTAVQTSREHTLRATNAVWHRPTAVAAEPAHEAVLHDTAGSVVPALESADTHKVSSAVTDNAAGDAVSLKASTPSTLPKIVWSCLTLILAVLLIAMLLRKCLGHRRKRDTSANATLKQKSAESAGRLHPSQHASPMDAVEQSDRVTEEVAGDNSVVVTAAPQTPSIEVESIQQDTPSIMPKNAEH